MGLNRGTGRREANSPRGEEGRTVHGALFSKSTPSLSPGKVYSKGRGSLRRHSFCSRCHAVYVQPYVFLCARVILCVPLNIWPHRILFLDPTADLMPVVLTSLASTARENSPLERERSDDLCSEDRGVSLSHINATPSHVSLGCRLSGLCCLLKGK